ncbi:protein KRI1 homolog [Xenia sp. Carnegie-2017]|uniref:protein KRI1 homolog n=1 Tax=Xenia sp. Carnegie-2017 TaxID=2897299 RepID=UPI001F03501B|nr:protein KRI1 homolog [Xenia sp. Carnegie-2017]
MADKMKYEKCALKINKKYAANFQKRSERAELDKLKDKYGEIVDNSESSSESEDEDARELNFEKEKNFLKTLALIKNKDPKIYDKNATFYSNEVILNEEKARKSDKPMFLKDYERKRLLEQGSELSESEESCSFEEKNKENGLTYIEEQEELKKSFKDAFNGDEDKSDFLKTRIKPKQEKETEDKEYLEWLKEKDLSEKDKTELEPLLQIWNNPDLDEDEKFLRNFILQKQYIDKDSLETPTYDEIVDDFEEDEEQLEKQEEFERKYNFRYEEPDSAQLKSYPRNVTGTLRRKDNKRKEKREERNERKLKEKEKKKQELKRLKNLKKKEILEKLEKLKEVTGNPNVGFNDEDLEGDFDPVKYDEAMQKAFDDEYYNEEETEKPEFNEEDWQDYEEENWDEWEGNDEGELHCDDPGFNMDADFDDTASTTMNENNRRKKSLFASAVYASKPSFDPNEKSFEAYFDEYYKLDYEDIIGDLPCRFKYRQVEPNDFGLTVDEILMCDDKELNQWASLKKSILYRTRDEERKDIKKYRQKEKI